MEPTYSDVDTYLVETLLDDDPALAGALAANRAAGLPAIDVSPPQGKLLNLLARAIGARRVLEIGTLGGYSTIWLARAVGEQGRVVTLEYEPRHAEVARANLGPGRPRGPRRDRRRRRVGHAAVAARPDRSTSSSSTRTRRTTRTMWSGRCG